jgi:mono/diheme cytochrome c family protein
MTIPHGVRIGALVIATTGFYTYVGQMVPQKEVQPPQEIALAADMTTADMVKIGGEVMQGKGLCFTCHTRGKSGALRFPDLEAGGPADRLQREVENATQLQRTLVDRLVAITRQSRALVARDVERGRMLTAEEAVAYGLVDEVSAPTAR